MRTFQYSDAKSHKFWHIEVQGNWYTVTYGKVGAKGQTTTKTFPSPQKAQQAADKVIAEKVGKGYRETTPSQKPPSLADALEQAILDDPGDLAAHAAYADFLQEQGDPRGEFIQTQLALDNPSISPDERKTLQERERALLKKYQKEWVGDWVTCPSTDNYDRRTYETPLTEGEPARFERGILAEARLGWINVPRARAFVADPRARLVRRLRLGFFDYQEEDHFEPGPDVPEGAQRPSQHVFLRWPGLPNLRVFQVGYRPQDENETSHECHTPGGLAHHLVKQMPLLEELYLLAHHVEGNKIFTMDLPRLRILQLDHSFDYPLDRLAKNASLTNLTRLLCHPHAVEPDEGEACINLKDLRAVIKSPHLKSLTHLRLRVADFGDKGAEEVVRSGILKRLKVLDFRHGAITDAGARALAACPDLRNLELLDLSWNYLTAEGIAAVEGTGVRALLGDQHTPDDDDDYDGPAYLFEGDIE